MSEYLLAISLGPVQGFIAAARKTRDLWFGSYLLSDIARQTAKNVADNGSDLIFPGVKDTQDLENEKFSVANVILAVVSGNPQEIAKQAEKAANDAWKAHVDVAKGKVENFPDGKNALRENVWKRQTDDFVEFYAAWVPYNANDYQKNRKRVMRLLAGRKACRDFVQEQSNDDRLPKSSLDGARDTVLQNLSENSPFKKNLHLRDGEQLDLIGVVKRFGGGHKKFPSVGEIAVNPVCIDRTEGFSAKEVDDDTDKHLQRLAEKSPYLAVICADGDKMGAAISSLDSPEKHKQFSIALSAFSQAVPGIVNAHYGECVYAGGDDVLAFVPVDKVLDCARKLSETFNEKLSAYKDVSLSVGVVIGHYHEMLETLLNFARQAESDAKKPNRNGLAIWMYHRGNSLCSVRKQWDEGLDVQIACWAKLFAEGKIPQKFPHDLQLFINLYQNVALTGDDLKDCLQNQMIATAKHKQVKADELDDAFHKIENIDAMNSLVNEMLIAQMIGDVIGKTKGGNNA